MARDKDPVLKSDQDFASAMTALIAPRWERVWADLDRLQKSDDADAIHDIRVASRRLRAAMDVAAPCYPAEWYAPLHRTARDITSALGDVRDRDVILEALGKDRESSADEDGPALDALITRVARERTLARRSMREFLAVLESSGARAATRERFGRPGKEAAR